MHRMETLELLACQMTDSSVQKTFWAAEDTYLKHTVVFICWRQLDQPLLQISDPSTQILVRRWSIMDADLWHSVSGNGFQRITSRQCCCWLANKHLVKIIYESRSTSNLPKEGLSFKQNEWQQWRWFAANCDPCWCQFGKLCFDVDDQWCRSLPACFQWAGQTLGPSANQVKISQNISETTN